MLTLQSPEDLKEYCLRKLGKPVHNVEIEDSQANDRVNDALEYFIERHFDGVTENYYKLTVKEADVTNQYVTVPNDLIVATEIIEQSSGSSVEVMDNFEFNMMDQMRMNGGSYDVIGYYLTMTHLKMVQDMFTRKKMFTFNNATNKITPLYKLSNVGSSNLVLSSTDISTADWTPINATLTGNDVELPNSKVTGDTITSDGAGVFGFEQEIESSSYVRGLYTFKIGVKSGTYTGAIKLSVHDTDDTLVAEQTFTNGTLWATNYVEATFDTTHTKNIKIKVEAIDGSAGAGETFMLSGITVFRNAMMLVQGYSAIDPDVSVNVYNDRWIKKYATALIKKQWGENIKKYEGVQMAGGISLNGQTIFDEAVAEIDKLEEEFSMSYELPVDGYIA